MAISAGQHYPILIIGAGISGIAAACQLKEKLGLTDFLVLEQQGGVGGTWWSHRYPGVACDVPAPLYSYSFAPNAAWSTLKPPGSEIQRYLVEVCEKFQILGNIQTNCTVTALDWNDSQHEWTAAIQTPQERHTTIRATIVITAVGKFGAPDLSILDGLEGRERFSGKILHSAQWDAAASAERGPVGRQKVTVIGGGCSAVQIVSELISARDLKKRACSVTQVIRSPHWVAPNSLSRWGTTQWERHMPWLLRGVPRLAWVVRLLIFIFTEWTYLLYSQAHSARGYFQRRREHQLLAHLRRTVPPHYADMLSPAYAVGCKRVINDAGWLSCLHSKRLQLYNLPIKRLEERTVILQDEKSLDIHIPTDLLVLATGYNHHHNRPLLESLRVTGRAGRDLHHTWQVQGGPQAYLTLAVDGFPNLFMLYGPNTSNGHTSVIFAIENTIDYIIQLARPIVAGHILTVEPKEVARRQWTRKVQAASASSVWVRGGCRNWYVDEQGGWNSMAYPFSQLHHLWAFSRVKWDDWDVVHAPDGQYSVGRTQGMTCVWPVGAFVLLAAIAVLVQSMF
ncbi:hypothetical protein BJX64DRAFT_302383 [Aspergillus heterothallicus]